MQSHCVLNQSRMQSHARPLARSGLARPVPWRCSAIKQQQQLSSPSSAPAKQPAQDSASKPSFLQRPEIINQDVPLSQQQKDALLPQPDTTVADPSALGVLENWAENYQMPDEMSIWDDGDYYSSRRDLQLAYTPPKSDLPGAAVALSLIACWVSHVGACAEAALTLSLCSRAGGQQPCTVQGPDTAQRMGASP